MAITYKEMMETLTAEAEARELARLEIARRKIRARIRKSLIEEEENEQLEEAVY